MQANIHNPIQELFESNGIYGNFVITMYHIHSDRTVFSSGCSIRFVDPKDQFLYELKGGDAVYEQTVTGMFNSAMFAECKTLMSGGQEHQDDDTVIRITETKYDF